VFSYCAVAYDLIIIPDEAQRFATPDDVASRAVRRKEAPSMTAQGLRSAFLGMLVSVLLAASSPAEMITLFGGNTDREVNKSGNYQNTTSSVLRVGRVGNGNSGLRNGLLVFDLSGISDPIIGATLGVYLKDENVRSDSNPFNVDLYGVGFRTSLNWSPTLDYHGSTSLDSPHTRIVDNFANPDSDDGEYLTTSTSSLLSYINSRLSGANFVFFRLSNDRERSQERYYEFKSGNSHSHKAYLALTTRTTTIAAAPEPSTLAGGALSTLVLAFALRRRRSR
jgi:hypothetical protein